MCIVIENHWKFFLLNGCVGQWRWITQQMTRDCIERYVWNVGGIKANKFRNNSGWFSNNWKII